MEEDEHYVSRQAQTTDTGDSLASLQITNLSDTRHDTEMGVDEEEEDSIRVENFVSPSIECKEIREDTTKRTRLMSHARYMMDKMATPFQTTIVEEREEQPTGGGGRSSHSLHTRGSVEDSQITMTMIPPETVATLDESSSLQALKESSVERRHVPRRLVEAPLEPEEEFQPFKQKRIKAAVGFLLICLASFAIFLALDSLFAIYMREPSSEKHPIHRLVTESTKSVGVSPTPNTNPNTLQLVQPMSMHLINESYSESDRETPELFLP